MTTQITLLCPGQGAQTVGMGKAWADASPEAKAVFDAADAFLGDRLGAPLSTLCFEGPEDRLNQTDTAQPALYTCAIAALAGWCAQQGTTPDALDLACAAGLSLGEYTALHAAGAISFEDGLELVTLRGRAMQDAAEASQGGMVALIGADEDQATQVCEKAAEGETLVPANFNAPGQIVISGHATACDRAIPVAEELGLRATKLAVAGAFHSPLMAPAADRLSEALAKVEFAAPRCPVMSNVTGQPHEADAASVRARLADQLTGAVRWAECCSHLNSAFGGEPHELAPGKTLAGLMRRIDRGVKVTPHDGP